MRKQVGLKFDEGDLARWDEWALAHGLTRTTLIETAVETLLSSDVPMLDVVERSPVPVVESKRRAFICPHETKGVRDCNRRTFLLSDEPDRVPDCQEHGAMVSQPNRQYLGQST